MSAMLHDFYSCLTDGFEFSECVLVVAVVELMVVCCSYV